jgi:hypothetical protein
MLKAVIGKDGAKNFITFDTVDELIDYMIDDDGYDWSFNKGDDWTWIAVSEESEAVIILNTMSDRRDLENIVKEIEALGSMIIDDENIGKGPVYNITGTLNTSWDHKWNPEDPDYEEADEE